MYKFTYTVSAIRANHDYSDWVHIEANNGFDSEISFVIPNKDVPKIGDVLVVDIKLDEE